MDDCISRQAAIEAVCKACNYDKEDYMNCTERDICDYMEAFNQLPSAQPEPHWIPCSERLPENRRYVLVTYEYEYGLNDWGITWFGERECKWDSNRNVIAWMPLPEPYKGDDDA